MPPKRRGSGDDSQFSFDFDSLRGEPEGARDESVRRASATLMPLATSSRRGVSTPRRRLDVFAGCVAVLCLGTNSGGSPRHPLYVRADQPLIALDPTR